jgi:hypothetical protein
LARSRIFPLIPLIPLIALILSCGVLINGCLNHSRLPSEGEERLIQQHSGVIVLLRLRTIVDGKPREDIRLVEKDERRGFGFDVDIATIDPGRSPDLLLKRPSILASPSSEALRKGWIYYVLPPGSYYFAVYDHEKKGTLPPGFMLTVSGEKRLVYAGTLDIACKRGSWSWNPPSLCSGVSLTDEGNAAKVLAQSYFAQHGPISTSLMSKYDEAAAASQRPAIFPMGYVTTGTKDLVSPDWTKRGIARTTGLGAVPADKMIKGILDAQWFGIAYLLYLPVGATIGAISGKAAAKKWQPCLQELAQEIKEIDPTAALQRKLNEELKKFPASKTVALPPEGDPFQVSGQRGLKSLLQVEVQRIQIRECQERGSFCVEVAIRARLWKISDKSLYLDKALVYTGTSPYERLPSEIQVPVPSPCRKMDRYCGPEGKQIFREEIAAAIPNLVERLLNEVGM